MASSFFHHLRKKPKKFKILCIKQQDIYDINPNKFKLPNPLFFMADMQQGVDPFWMEVNVRFRDLEEKSKILRDRVLLIGQNLIETKEKTSEDILEIKKDIEIIKKDMERLVSFLETASAEFSKFARKEDLEILSKQAKMFQPLEFVRKKDLKK